MVVLLKALDIGMLVGFYRTFDPLSDPSYAGAGYGVLRDSVGGLAPSWWPSRWGWRLSRPSSSYRWLRCG